MTVQQTSVPSRRVLSGVVIVGAVVGLSAMLLAQGGDYSAPTQLFASGGKPSEIVGPDECKKCHVKEEETWQLTHHHSTFIDLPRNDKAREIARKLGIRRIKQDSTCISCHYTVKEVGGEMEAISGISCESCHGAGEKWLDVHATYAEGVDRETETESQREQRLEAAIALDMLPPDDLYAVAENCFQCHTAPNQELVDVGGHPAGSRFELVSWSQGEVRHNFNRVDNAHNAISSPERLRVLYVLGKALELEYALRGLSKATEAKLYGRAMAQRTVLAWRALKEIQAAQPIDEVASMIAIFDEPQKELGAMFGNEQALLAKADEVQKHAKAFANNYDGSDLGGVDALIPDESEWKGEAANP
jgi:hypothetical protein